jgi:hydrophobe/amphiphile efflux-1 (HAE1) family protein
MNLAELSIKRPVFITCIVALMLVGGTLAMKNMSVDLFPDVTFPTMFVQTIYPGASPSDVEKQVSKPIEDELGSLPGLDKLFSQNPESGSFVILQFKIGTDIKEMEQQVRQRLGNIRNKLPQDIKEPIIRRFDPADQPVATLAITSTIEPAALYDLVDQTVKNQFETIPGVGLVNIVGGRKREILIDVDKNKLQDRKLSLLQVVDKIQKTSKDVPVGTLKNDLSERTIKASGEFESLDSIKKVNVNFFGSDRPVRLEEIAFVKSGLEEEQSQFTFRDRSNSFQKEQAISLSIYKQSGANTVQIVDLIQAKLTKVNELLASRNLNAEVKMIREISRPIRMNIEDVTHSIVLGVILCVIVVLFFLGSFKSTFITGMALPNSLLGGFIIMFACGFTINILTLLALSLAVGLLIDDAIVVRENIFRHMEMGKDPRRASIEGTKEVALAVIATTLVVISVFGPIAFMKGIVGQFFKQFGLTVVFTMLISLFDAFTVAPMLSTYLAAHKDHGKKGLWDRFFEKVERFHVGLENRYEKLASWVLNNRKKVLLASVGIFVGSFALLGKIPKNFLPAGDNGEFQVNIELPLGSSLTQTKELMNEIEEVIIKNPGVAIVASNAGFNNRFESTKGTIYTRLVPRKERQFKTSDIKQQMREAFKVFEKRATVNVADIDIGGGAMKPVNLVLRSDDLDQLAKYVEKLKPRFKEIPGLADVDTNFRTGKPELQIAFNRDLSEKLGVSTTTAGTELRARTEGIVAAVFREKGLEYDIRVRLADEFRDLKKEFNTTLVPNVNFNMVPLNKVAAISDSMTFSQINRLNKSRYIMIDGNVGPGGALGSIMSDLEKLLKNDPEFKMPQGVSYEFIGQAEDFKDLMRNMLTAMGLGVLLIYLVLASLYESFIIPLTILTALPLAITGVFIALFITQHSIDLFSMIGIIMLLGVVAKNSILLVDYTNQEMQKGVERNRALLNACKVRLRPILMTSLALIAGTIPIAVGMTEASAMRTSMGISIIGGLISSTLLTLLVVPAAFGYVDDFKNFLTRFTDWISGKPLDKPFKSEKLSTKGSTIDLPH